MVIRWAGVWGADSSSATGSQVPFYMFGEVWAHWPLASLVHPGWREAFRFIDSLGVVFGFMGKKDRPMSTFVTHGANQPEPASAFLGTAQKGLQTCWLSLWVYIHRRASMAWPGVAGAGRSRSGHSNRRVTGMANKHSEKSGSKSCGGGPSSRAPSCSARWPALQLRRRLSPCCWPRKQSTYVPCDI